MYSQHLAGLLSLGIIANPLEQFWEDFWEQIDKWLDEGDKLINGEDWNVNVKDEGFFLPFQQRGLYPVLSTLVSTPPETNTRGSNPIDENNHRDLKMWIFRLWNNSKRS